MEFGVLIHGYCPRKPHDNDHEHDWVRREIELVTEADRYGFKYAWLTEHHFLEEYSHLSASEVFIPYLGALTEQIHIGSGIFNLNPQVNHPARLAERVAMLDHLMDRRFEFGTGRGAGAYEVGGFGITDTDATKAVWEEEAASCPRRATCASVCVAAPWSIKWRFPSGSCRAERGRSVCRVSWDGGAPWR